MSECKHEFGRDFIGESTCNNCGMYEDTFFYIEQLEQQLKEMTALVDAGCAWSSELLQRKQQILEEK